MIFTSPAFKRIPRKPMTAICFLSLLVVVLIVPFTLEAQEEGKEDVHHVGAHDIRVLPVNLNLGAGSAQYAVIVTNPEDGEPVPDANVVLIASNSEEGNPGWAIATNSPAVPEQYDVHLKLDSTGEWEISADVSSSLGADLVEVTTLEVPSVNRLTQGTWVFVGVFAVIFGGIAYVWWSARRNYRRKRAAQADAP
jgi:hypothetical protein